MKKDFAQLQYYNDGSETLETETTIDNKQCSIYYFNDRDEI